MRRLAAFREHLKERLEYTRPAEPPEPLPYAVPCAKFFGQRSPGNAVDREIVDCLQEFTVVMPRLSLARLHRVEHSKCDPPIPLRHSRKHVRLPDAGHAVIRLISDSGIRQKCIAGIPSTQPRVRSAPAVDNLAAAGSGNPGFSILLPPDFQRLNVPIVSLCNGVNFPEGRF